MVGIAARNVKKPLVHFLTLSLLKNLHIQGSPARVEFFLFSNDLKCGFEGINTRSKRWSTCRIEY